ncbi:hypothetical protein BGX21_003651 [Mortierella sp. AD011]|nr:hypothetical protein BGX20_009531 [Mortierella sp. AD010]KAF9375939.1 hypothetical protein BGX21_003651 [Mortierella sp. AD011]
MSSPIQVDGVLLQRLNQLGPAVGLDIQVFKSTGKASTAEATAAATTAPATENSTESNKRTKFVFQPQRKYFLEGRIIHKRKLSRKLFFLDVSLVRRKVSSAGEDRPVGNSISLPSSESTTKGEEAIEAQGADGFKRSEWEDIEPTHGSTKDHQSPPNYNPCLRMEVIARYPAHSLKELDDLWQKVQLGSVIRVYGDIEISEKHTSCPSDIANGSSENTQQEQQSRWSALLHCLDFEVLELWQGKDGFEPNPGSSVISGLSKDESNQTSATGQNKKRKNEELSASSPVTGSGQDRSGPALKHQRGDESQPHCKFWLNSGKCNKEQCLFWHETDQAKLKVERRRWVEERIRAKRQISHHASDPHQKTTKNQHRERALYFSHWLIKTFTRDFLNSGSGVLDIAGGRGDLSWELQTRQGIQSTIVEPRPGKGMRKWQRKWLQKFKASNQQDSSAQSELETPSTTELSGTLQASDVVEDPEDQEPDEGKVLEGLEDLIPTVLTYPLQATEPARIQTMLDDQFLVIHQDLINGASILIGLHPDQATEPIVRTALKLGKPFAVIPCCVFGRDNPHRRLPKKDLETEECVENEENNDPLTRPVTSYDDFVTWLSTLHPDIETTWLNFEGMNRVLYWRGPSIP